MNKDIRMEFVAEKKYMDSFFCQNEKSEVVNVSNYITGIVRDDNMEEQEEETNDSNSSSSENEGEDSK